MGESAQSAAWESHEEMVFRATSKLMRRLVGDFYDSAAAAGSPLRHRLETDGALAIQLQYAAVRLVGQINCRCATAGRPHLSEDQIADKARQWSWWWVDCWDEGKAHAPFTAASRARGRRHSAARRAAARRARRQQLARFFADHTPHQHSNAQLAQHFGCSAETIRLDRLEYWRQRAKIVAAWALSTAPNLLSGGVEHVKNLFKWYKPPPDSKLGSVENRGPHSYHGQHRRHLWWWSVVDEVAADRLRGGYLLE